MLRSQSRQVRVGFTEVLQKRNFSSARQMFVPLQTSETQATVASSAVSKATGDASNQL